MHTFHIPLSLRTHYSELLAISHPSVVTKLHLGKGILDQVNVSQKIGKALSQVPTQINSLQSPIAYMCVPPKEMCPFSFQ
jgi:hypothetical protein